MVLPDSGPPGAVPSTLPAPQRRSTGLVPTCRGRHERFFARSVSWLPSLEEMKRNERPSSVGTIPGVAVGEHLIDELREGVAARVICKGKGIGVVLVSVSLGNRIDVLVVKDSWLIRQHRGIVASYFKADVAVLGKAYDCFDLVSDRNRCGHK